MTDRIQHIIEEIRLKSKALHHQLLEEREKNNALQAEVQLLNERLHQKNQQEEKNLAEIAALKLEMETTKSQVIEIERPHGKRDEEIDELVMEIEYCISQLKK